MRPVTTDDLRLQGDLYGSWWFDQPINYRVPAGVTVTSSEFEADLIAANPEPYVKFSGTGNAKIVTQWIANPNGVKHMRGALAGMVGLYAAGVTVSLDVEYGLKGSDTPGTSVQARSSTMDNRTGAGWHQINAYRQTVGDGYDQYRFVINVTAAGAWKVALRQMVGTHFTLVVSDWFYWDTQGQHQIYANMLPSATGIKIRRGARPNPPLDQLEIGTMSVDFANLGYATRVYRSEYNQADVEIGWDATFGDVIRLQTKKDGRWVTVFQGQVAERTKEFGAVYSQDRGSMVVTDAVHDLALAPKPLVKNGSFRQRVINILTPDSADFGQVQAQPVAYNIVDSGTDIATPANLLRADVAMLDQLLTARNNERGLVWVDRNNVVQARARANIPAWSETIRFTEGRADLANEIEMLAQGWDKNLENKFASNYLFVKKAGIRASNGEGYELTYGPYLDTQRMAWGTNQGTVTVSDADPLTTAKEYLYLYQYRNPIDQQTAMEYLRFNATNLAGRHATLDIYDGVWVDYTRLANGFMKKYRILALEHDIKPGEWITTVHLRPTEIFDNGSKEAISYRGQGNTAPDGTVNVVPT